MRKGRPSGSVQNLFQKVERLRYLYIEHCELVGKPHSQRYQGVLDGIDLCMELAESIKAFQNDIKEIKLTKGLKNETNAQSKTSCE
tara:strand:- start:3834 stop:4091 length:258 start_codon:yes stop_codon:yes gene_type:complete